MERNESTSTSRNGTTVPHPYDSANWLSRTTLQWMNTVLRAGSKKPLEKEDIFPVRDVDSMDHLVNKLENEWEREVNNSRAVGCKPRMWKAFFRMFSWKAYAALVTLKVLRLLASVLLPLLLWFFLSDLERIQQGYSVSSFLFAAGIILLATIKGMTRGHFSGMTETWGIRLKVASIGLVYKKVSVTNLKYTCNMNCCLDKALILSGGLRMGGVSLWSKRKCLGQGKSQCTRRGENQCTRLRPTVLQDYNNRFCWLVGLWALNSGIIITE